MPALRITVQGLAGEAAGGSLGARFDERGGSIGRADDNTLVLPDPRRHISRHQADIVFQAGAFQIVNAAQSNPITLNRSTLEPGAARPLREGDELLIGGYVLRVDGPDEARPSAAPPPETDPFGSAWPELQAPRAPTPAPGVPAAAFTPATPPPRSPLPDDYDPFATTGFGAPSSPPGAPPAAFPPAAPVAPPALGAGLLPGAIPDARGSSIDALFGLDRAPPTAWDELLAPAAPGPAAPADTGRGLDPLARFAPAPPPGMALPSRAAAWEDHTPELHTPFQPPAIRHRPAPPVPEAEATHPAVRAMGAGPAAAPPPRAAAQPERAARLWRAFEEGAGLPPSGEALNEEALAERLRLLGALMVAGLDGTLRLMAARASTKQELRAEVTVIQPSGNNPLKFTRDAQAALLSLVKPPARGFMPAVPAWTDAMDDLLGHTVGTMAGMRAALDGLLAHFEPEKLEAALASPSLLESLLPAHRRAHLWQAYLERYGQVHKAAAEDFHGLFGRAFVQAYEAQLQRLDDARAADPGTASKGAAP